MNVVKGKILDLVIDLRRKSKTFGKVFSIILSKNNANIDLTFDEKVNAQAGKYINIYKRSDASFNDKDITNTHAIGKVLYTDYFFMFQISGCILLVAMIGAIVLTLRKREGVRRQNISEQLKRNKENSIEIIRVEKE